MIDEKTTRDLLTVLQKIDQKDALDDYLSDITSADPVPFSDYFRSLPSVQRFSNADLIRRSGIERTYFYQLINGTRKPGRDKVILLGLAAELTVKEVQRALETSQLGILYAKKRRDSILIFALEQHLGLDDTQELLSSYQEELLS